MIIDFISRLKRKNKKKEITLKEISRLWVDSEKKETPEQIKYEGGENQWNNPDINSFYIYYVLPYSSVPGNAIATIQKILTLLDKSGNCSSVANDPSETTNIKYADITLTEHSLNVARKIIDMIKNRIKDHEFIAGEMLIIALGHNLGKITNDKKLPVDLPTQSALAIEQFVKDLPYKQTVIQAIKTYKNSPKLNQAKLLNSADYSARKIEGSFL